ncbi:MAG: hypothetical protein MHPSP_002080 [Paramarteilia canceri]
MVDFHLCHLVECSEPSVKELALHLASSSSSTCSFMETLPREKTLFLVQDKSEAEALRELVRQKLDSSA